MQGSIEHNRNVLIYRQRLLTASETFIRRQAESVPRSSTAYLGVSRVPGLDLPDDRTFTLSPSARLNAATAGVLASTGHAPGLKRVMNRVGPSLIHAHFMADAAQIARAARRFNIPLIATAHGADVTTTLENLAARSKAGKWYVDRRHELYDDVALVIAVSDFISDCLVDLGVPSEKIRRHYIGIDCDRFQPRFAATQRERAVLFVGRLVEKKGCAYLIEAFGRLNRREDFDLELHIVGDGPERDHLERLASETGAKIRFLGFLNEDEVADRMARSLVFAAPSLRASSGDTEGFGLVFTEAQACGTPVVGFKSGGVVEAVADGETGLLYNERDGVGLADGIYQLATQHDVWGRMSEAGVNRVRRMFDLRRQSAELEEIYDEALERAAW